MKRSAPACEALGRLVGTLAGVLLLGSIPPLVGLPATAQVSATGCSALGVERYGDPPGSAVLVTAPTALRGQELQASNVTLSQRGEPVKLRSVQRLDASRVDLAIVLDTGASAPDSAFARARRFAVSFLSDLPAGLRVAVVSAGSNPKVLSGLSADRQRALTAVRQARRSSRHAAVEGVALAGDLLTAGPARSRHVVLISTGRSDASRREFVQVRTSLDERGVKVHAVGMRGPVERSWGSQCPAAVSAGQEEAAGSLLALRVAETYEVVAGEADSSAPMTVRVRSGAVDASAQIRSLAPDTAVRGTRIPGSEPTGSGPGSWVWILAGAAVVAVALVAGLLRLAPVNPPGRRSRPRPNLFAETHSILLPQEPSDPPDPPLPGSRPGPPI